MMRSLLIALSIVFCATLAQSQTVQIRSGQHDDFTRLIVDLPERLEIKIEQDSENAIISFPGQKLTFDSSQVFRRISRERIADVKQGDDPSTLRVSFGCRCEISTFWHNTSLLVLDIRESETDLQRPIVVENQPPTIAAAPEPQEAIATEKRRLVLSQNTGSFAASLANTRLQVDTPDTSPPETSAAMQKTDEETANQEVISKARERLIQQLGRAASQGLLEPKSVLRSEPTPDIADDVVENDQVEEQLTNDPQEHINLMAQSSVDRDFLAAIEGRAATTFGTACFAPYQIDVSNWGSDKPFAEQVGSVRVNLMGEFDQLNQQAAEQLVKLYIHYGFGAEAILALELIEQETETTSVLRSLAEIMKDGHTPPNSVLFGQLSCDGPAALWSMLAYPSLPSDVTIEFDAALRAFVALPNHLRSHLGATLSQRFLDAGHSEAADRLLRILNRSDETITPEAQLVEAEIDLSEGMHSDANALMKDVVEANSEPSADALIRLIDTSIQSGKAVSYDHAVLASAYAVQNRGEPIEKELVRVYIAGLSASGNFEQSYGEYSRLSYVLSEDRRAELNSEMLNQLTSNAGSVTFLKYALTHHVGTHSPSVANSAASRLMDLGFATQARQFIKDKVVGDAGQDRQILLARISLAEGRPEQAETELAGLTGEAVDLLRARARDLVGDHRTASVLFSSAGEQHQSLRQMWLSEDWGSLKASKNQTMADFAALVELGLEPTDPGSELLPATEDEHLLADDRELLQQSLAARETILSVLQENPSP